MNTCKYRFNSRTPCGVRPIQPYLVDKSKYVSIHAPRVGCDTAPTPEATTVSVSIHAPRVGCDLNGHTALLHRLVSIHAPRVGCDSAHCCALAMSGRFNSRTPCGVRLSISFCRATASAFQFTHPVWGATRDGGEISDRLFVSIHAPRVGCDSKQQQ